MLLPFKRLSISKRLLTTPLLFSLGSICLLGLMAWQSQQAAKNAASINLAGRQRMLNQRHSREVLLASNGDESRLMKTRDLLMKSIDFLIDGGEHPFGVIPQCNSLKLHAALEKQRAELEKQFSIADEFLASQGNDSTLSANLNAELDEQTKVCHEAAHAVVVCIAEHSTEAQANSFLIAIATGLFVIIGSSSWSILITRAVSKQIASTLSRVRNLSSHDLKDVSRQLRDDAGQTSSQASNASEAAEEVSINASALASAVEQFEESIKEIAGNASNAAIVARDAVQASEQTNTTISRLGESSAEIGNVLKAINSIAEQTNLLALNATIEAARAGEAGKGFAVVANEVKELAKETSRATDDIVERIAAIQTDTEQAVSAIANVGNIISDIHETQSAIASAVEEQTTMTSEISSNISGVASGSSNIANSISLVASAAKSTQSGSDETMSTAANIELLVEELMAIVGQAKNEIGSKQQTVSTL